MAHKYRKETRLKEYDYSSDGVYFVTMCSKDRKPLLWDNYVIMPNHVHLLLKIETFEIGRPMVAPTISRIIKQMKGYVSKQIGYSIWQKMFFDHIIRNERDYLEHCTYFKNNPLKWELDELYCE